MLNYSIRLLYLLVFLSLSACGRTGQANQAPQITIVSQNLNRLFADKNDGNREKVVSTRIYQNRLNKLVRKIEREFDFPEVMAFQEIENINILDDVSQRLRTQFNQPYRALLIEGNDTSGIDVGYLVKQSLEIKDTRSLFKNHKLRLSNEFLFSRPPLLLEACVDECVTFINLHLKSMRGLRSPKKGKRVLEKRVRQAETLAQWIHDLQDRHPHKRLVVLGDFNALTPSDKYADIIGTLLGAPDQQRPQRTSPDLITRDLINATQIIPAKQRYSFVYKKQRQQLDYLLMSENLKESLTQIVFSRIDYDFSDHSAVIAHFSFN